MLPRPRNSRMIRRLPSPSRVARSFVLIGGALLLPIAATSQTTQARDDADLCRTGRAVLRIGTGPHRRVHQVPGADSGAAQVVAARLARASRRQIHPGPHRLARFGPEKTRRRSREVRVRFTGSFLSPRRHAQGCGRARTRNSVTVNLDAAHTQLDKILSGREFGAAQGPSQLDILKARIARWLSEQIYKLLQRLHLGAKAGNALAWIIVGLAFVALCYWVWKTLSPTTRKRETRAEGAKESDDPREWARDALAAADRGDYREAVHCAYWAAVVHLETLRVLKRDRARTPRESLRLLDPHPNEQNLLREFTRRFELIWYGYRPASASDWSEARSHLEKMGCLTPSTAATANS